MREDRHSLLLYYASSDCAQYPDAGTVRDQDGAASAFAEQLRSHSNHHSCPTDRGRFRRLVPDRGLRGGYEHVAVLAEVQFQQGEVVDVYPTILVEI